VRPQERMPCHGDRERGAATAGQAFPDHSSATSSPPKHAQMESTIHFGATRDRNGVWVAPDRNGDAKRHRHRAGRSAWRRGGADGGRRPETVGLQSQRDRRRCCGAAPRHPACFCAGDAALQWKPLHAAPGDPRRGTAANAQNPGRFGRVQNDRRRKEYSDPPCMDRPIDETSRSPRHARQRSTSSAEDELKLGHVLGL